MTREEAEIKYKELLENLAKYHFDGNTAMVNATFREIEKVRRRILNLDVAEAIATYQEEQKNNMKVQK